MLTRVLLVFVCGVVGYGLVESKKYCQTYQIFTAHRRVSSWTEAREFCQNKGYDLVKIDNRMENNMLVTFLRQERTKRRQDGWWIGGKYENGQWRWADGSFMVYQNFPSSSRHLLEFGQVTNYAAIFKTSPYGAYTWGYLSPMSSNKMGIICESTSCT